MEKIKLTNKERKTVERLVYTLISGVVLTTGGVSLAAAGLEKYGLVAGITGGILTATYAGFMYSPFVPSRDNKYRQIKKRYLEELAEEK